MNSAVRAWVTAHDGWAVLTALAALTLVTSTFAYRQVTGFDGPGIPVWLFYPSLLSMVVGLASRNGLPPVHIHRWTSVASRFAWCGALTSVAVVCAAAVELQLRQAGIVVATVVLTGLTWLLAGFAGRGSALVGAASCVGTLVFARSVQDLASSSLLADVGRVPVAALSAATFVSLGVYALWKPRSPP